MDFSFPQHPKIGVLNEEDLKFFYYEIGLDNLQGFPELYEWDQVIKEFNGIINFQESESSQIPLLPENNSFYFTVSVDDKKGNLICNSFYRHIRNCFAHYGINHEGDFYFFTDEDKGRITMKGKIEVKLFKKFIDKFSFQQEQFLNRTF